MKSFEKEEKDEKNEKNEKDEKDEKDEKELILIKKKITIVVKKLK